MGFWLSKSIKVLPGVRLHISPRGVGYSVGSRNLKLTRHPDGRVTRTVGVGGLHHSSTIRPAGGHPQPPPPAPYPPPYPDPPAPAYPPPPPYVPPPPYPAPHPDLPPGPRPHAVPPQPGPAAPAWERDLLDAERSGRYAEVARTHGRAEPAVRVLAAVLDGLDHVAHDPGRARELLAWAVAQGTGELHRHPYVLTHLGDRAWPVEIAGGVVAELRIADDVALLAVAELHQAAGDLDVAIWTVEQAQPTAPAALSLVELYSDAGRHHDVIDMTAATTNQDDATALLLVLRGRAFTHLGEPTAALSAFGEALRMRARAAPVRHRALLERAKVFAAQDRPEAARQDLEAVRAEDPHHPALAASPDARPPR